MASTQVRSFSWLLTLLCTLLACSTATAEGRMQTIIAAGAEYGSMSRSDVATTWLAYSAAAPWWGLRCRLRLPARNSVSVEFDAGFSYFESNKCAENGTPLRKGEMRFLAIEAPVGIECAVPAVGRFMLVGALEASAMYREYGRVVSEDGNDQTKDLAIGAIGRWGFGIRVIDGLRIMLLAELMAGIPVYGVEALPSGETWRRDTWRAGIGASAVVELVLGYLYTRATVDFSGSSEVTFTTHEGYRGFGSILVRDARLGMELGVRL